MGVVRTDKWLALYEKYWDQQKRKNDKYKWQQQILIRPLAKHFKTEDVQTLQYYLHDMGLFHPDVAIKATLIQFHEKKWWNVIHTQFKLLQKKWHGPDVPIYLFPVELRHEVISSKLGGKMGLTLPHMILLFIDSKLEVDDVRALLTHEYHHVCRLSYTGETEDTISLLESMLMEGLAEIAVEEEVGKHALAIWTKYYDEVWQDDWFKTMIKPNLFLKGRERHRQYLYGDTHRGIPRWLGYYWGFQCVRTIEQNSRSFKTKEWIRCEAKKMLETYYHERGCPDMG